MKKVPVPVPRLSVPDTMARVSVWYAPDADVSLAAYVRALHTLAQALYAQDAQE